MIGHDFVNGIQKDKVSGMEYRKCQRCNKVMFEHGDDYFNMICLPVAKAIEDTRERLEKGL